MQEYQEKLTKRIAIKDEICLDYGDKDWLHKKYGIDSETIIRKIFDWMNT